jgi:hypothetical protein
MTEELYYATIWIMYNRYKAPPTPIYISSPGKLPPHNAAIDSLEMLIAMKEFFAKTLHPNWMPQQIKKLIAPEDALIHAFSR